MKALYSKQTGFRDSVSNPRLVEILGFVHGEFEPGYQYEKKRCVLAIVADEDGNLFETELFTLTLEKARSCTKDK